MDCNYNKIEKIFLVTVCLIICNTDLSFAQLIYLDDLSAFSNPSNNWQIIGDIFTNPATEDISISEKGSGILVGSISSLQQSSSLATKINHGDLAIEFDVLLSTNAIASIWLQGRYGLYLADNWSTETIKNAKNGALISPPVKGIESIGYNPRQNVSRAPGLWQHVKIVFHAPRFDKNGNKISKAKFILVRQNGVSIQENQTMPLPSDGAISRNEVSNGPIVFKIHKGTVALKNIKYTASSGKKVKMENLMYKLYLDKFLDEDFFYGSGKEGPIKLPDFTFKEPADKGSINLIHTNMANEAGGDFAIVFEGQLNIPESGKYQFEVVENGIGSFKVDKKEYLRWDVYHKKGSNKREIKLSKGIYPFKLTVVNFGDPRAGIFVNGPGIIHQPLHELPRLSEVISVRPILLQPKGEPLIQRSFIFHNNQKLLNCINVGYPEEINYSYNLSTGALLQVWRGKFGDVTSMWHDRGLQQVLKPLGSILTLTPRQHVFLSDREKIGSQMDFDFGELILEGYDINQNGEPVYQYTLGNIGIRDFITLGSNGQTLKRTLRFVKRGEVSKSVVWYEIAKASKIEQVDNRLYAIGDKTYFLEVKEGSAVEIKQEGKNQTLFVPIVIGSEPEIIRYSLIW